jgi:F420-dependent oxidoreductase-like protein
VRFDKPLARTREYVEIVQKALRRERLSYEGEHFTLPLPHGPGKALQLTVRPVREHIPLYLAAVGPRNLELTGEVADGWLAIFFSPEHAAESLDHIRAGRERRDGADMGGGGGLAGFDVVPTVPVVLGDDLEACAAPVRAYSALYVGGMGSRSANFYNQQAVRMGYGDAAERIQQLYLDRRPREAAAAVPLEFVDRTALIGPVDRVGDRLHAYAEAGVTTLSVALYAGSLDERLETLRAMVGAVERAGLTSWS